jgi:hypothetical protein
MLDNLVSTWEVQVCYATYTGPNLAPSATATASTETSANFNAAKAADGNSATRWSASTALGDQWLELDWASAQTFNTIAINSFLWNNPVVAKLWNGSGWDTVASQSGANQMTITLPSEVTTTRLLLDNLVSTWEVQAYLVSGSVVSMFGKDVSVYGTVNTSGGEKVITAMQVVGGADHILAPLGMSNRALSIEQKGASSVALLVCVWGRVQRLGDGFMYIDDGSKVLSADVPGVKVIFGGVNPGLSEGDIVRVTGIARAIDSGNVTERTVFIRSASDIEKM